MCVPFFLGLLCTLLLCVVIHCSSHRSPFVRLYQLENRGRNTRLKKRKTQVDSGYDAETVEDIDTCTSVWLDEKGERRGKPSLALEDVATTLQASGSTLCLVLVLVLGGGP